MSKFARELAPGDVVTVNGSQRVTVATIDHLDARWVSNGVVHFTSTAGHRYGFKSLDLVEVR